MRIIALTTSSDRDARSGHRRQQCTTIFRELLATGEIDELRELDNTEPASLTTVADVALIDTPEWELATPATIRTVLATLRSSDTPAAVATRPVTDTIKLLDQHGTLQGTWHRDRLRELLSPLCCRTAPIAPLGRLPHLEELAATGVRLVNGESQH